MNLDFWQNKRVFLTGHTGFKGSWLSLWLQELGAEVVGFSTAPPSQPNLFERVNIAAGMTSIIGDVRDLATLQSAVTNAQPDIALHLAAQPLVRYSYTNPIETYTTNVMGTVNFLESVRHTPSVRSAVVITTDKCYKNKEWAWGYREDEEMGGYDPYSNSKACAELVTAAYRDSYLSSPTQGFSTAVASARAGNVIGGGDWAADRLIPDVVRAISDRRPVLIRYPNSIRPWQHVLEPLSGYLTLAEKLWFEGSLYAEGWNFGPDDRDARSVEWVVNTITSLWGDGASWTTDNANHPHEAKYLKLDCSKAKQRLQWYPQLSLEQALQWTVELYKACLQEDSPREVMLGQMKQFANLKVPIAA